MWRGLVEICDGNGATLWELKFAGMANLVVRKTTPTPCNAEHCEDIVPEFFEFLGVSMIKS
ncbi:MAG: hypothetical protein KKA52_09005 [Candidatus Omnitrophica bacterium]|nr:hypothetical protein [Candidatus Omnitrophota bacterium]